MQEAVGNNLTFTVEIFLNSVEILDSFLLETSLISLTIYYFSAMYVYHIRKSSRFSLLFKLNFPVFIS